ncbi:translation initiation factor eIF 4e-like domain-containing protein [Infundibulicybe gibba]|nr:translation initiation factor eIF 4e-like domain-containing protein [Infundibulicybe gibba]
MTSTTASATPDSIKKSQSSRLPSLDQLVARVNIGNTSGTPTQSKTLAPRPRLAASVLRTGSSVSISTNASTTDSTAVNAPNTRSTGGDPLTTESIEKLNSETAAAAPATEKRATKVGYKNIPSLDAITARLGKPELIEDPKTPGVPMKAPEHPLQYPWTIYHDTKAKFPYPPPSQPATASTTPSEPTFAPPESTDYEAGLTVIGEFDTVEEFCRYLNWLKPPSKLERNSNYHIFKSGIKPMWEDEANANGGKWVLTMKNNPVLLDRCWNWLAMALVGEELEEGDEICGAVVSLRSKVDRIQLWTRSKDDVEKLNSIGRKLVKLLDVSEADNIGLEFQYNTDDRPLPNKFLSIQSMPTTSFRSTFQGGNGPLSAGGHGPQSASSAGGAAFGSFGMGIGGGWKGAKRA